MLTCNAIHSPPGHGPRSHGLLPTGSPTQDLPPGLGGGLSHRRVLILVPGPHDVLQALHSLQFPHPPLTTATKRIKVWTSTCGCTSWTSLVPARPYFSEISYSAAYEIRFHTLIMEIVALSWNFNWIFCKIILFISVILPNNYSVKSLPIAFLSPLFILSSAVNLFLSLFCQSFLLHSFVRLGRK